MSIKINTNYRATSDALEQIIIMVPVQYLSARTFKELEFVVEQTRQLSREQLTRNYLGDAVKPETKEQIEKLGKGAD